MKRTLLLALFATSTALGQVNVQKASGTNVLTGSLVVDSGKSISATGTGTIAATSFPGILPGANGGTGVANTGRTLTMGGNVSFSGAVTFTGVADVTINSLSGQFQLIAGATSPKTLTILNSVAFSGVDGSTLTISTGGTLGTAAFTAATDYQANGASIETVANLAALATTGLTVPVIRVWIQTSDGTVQTWILRAGTDATDAGSVQRPNDYNGSTNAKVWYRAG